MKRLREFVRQERCRRKLSPQALASDIEYRNVNRGANRILRFEREGEIDEALLLAIVDALGLDRKECQRLADRDRRDVEAAFERWASEPVKPQFVLVPLAAVQVSHPLPIEVQSDRERAAKYAQKVAADRGSRAPLVWDRRWTYWIGRDGTGGWGETTPDSINVPHATPGGKAVKLEFT